MPASPNANDSIIRRFRDARLAGGMVDVFPGEMPDTLDAAYALQDAAIAQWPDTITGWKVAGILPQFRESLGASRLSGPVFAAQTRYAHTQPPVPFGIFAHGFAAIEAEFIFRMGKDVPGTLTQPDALIPYIAALHVGMETAGSPFAAINALGPLSVVSDFGNNAGIIVGAEINGWADQPLEVLTARALVNGELVGEGSAAKVMGGPLAALAFLVENLSHRGRSLKAGDYVSTGMTTGIHLVKAGDHVRLEFAGNHAFEAIAGLKPQVL